MLGTGKSSGCINEASNLLANQNLTQTIQQMGSEAYQRTRDLNDIVPTHRLPASTDGESRAQDANLQVFDPVAEKKGEKILNGSAEEDDDDELLRLRQQRLTLLRKSQEDHILYKSKQHGEYREIAQDDFFNVVVREKGGSDRCCVHFYHKEFESCKQMDHHLSQLARQVMSIRFCKIDAEKCPFLVERLRVTTLPCCLLFKDDVAVDRIIGFEGCIGEDGLLDQEALKERIFGVLGKKEVDTL